MSQPDQRHGRTVLMFAGQGAQHPRMGAGLYGHEETFTVWMDEAFRLLGDEGPDLRRRWLAPAASPGFDDVTVAQPLLYAVDHALGRMVLSWGVRPVALLGHSVGEFAAATLAGVVRFADGIRLMQERVEHISLTPPGGMLAVAAGTADVADLLADPGIWLAAENSTRQILLAGERSDLDRAMTWLAERDITCRDVATRQAFHSPVVADAVRATLPAFRRTTLHPPTIRLYSCHTRAPVSDQQAGDPDFWAWQASTTVEFGPTLTTLLRDHPGCALLETGPGDSLTRLVRRHPRVREAGNLVASLLPARSAGDEADRAHAATARAALGLTAAPARLTRTAGPVVHPHRSSRVLGSGRSETPVADPAARTDPDRGWSTGPDELAVVGMACRLPGAGDLDEFWRLLTTGVDAVAPGTGDAAGRRPGGYLPDRALFDAALFGITPPEASAMDPQQRLLLELCWHALEDARIPPRPARPTGEVGVFVGCCSDEYAALARSLGLRGDPYRVTGAARAFLANRLSHTFAFTGPSMVVDTGQSSSLVALHQAAVSLRSGECDLAVVAGVQLNLTQEGDDLLEDLGALSPTGHCRPLDADADGIARGEGAAVIVLRPLAAAAAAGDRIYCTLAASAVNNDGGRETGLTNPSGSAQRQLLTNAYAAGDRRPGAGEVQYVELHGTGTRAGDPVEAGALGAVLGSGRSPRQPLLVGSLKANIGHLEAAAGLASVLKVALSLHHRELAPTLHHRRPNPAIDLDRLGLQVCTERRSWPAPDRRLVAGVSSFGLGGTNCHAVLAEAPTGTRPPEGTRSGFGVVALSGHSRAALREQAGRLARRVTGGDGRADAALSIPDLAVASLTTRAQLPHRAAVVARTAAELVSGLGRVAAGEHGPPVPVHAHPRDVPPGRPAPAGGGRPTGPPDTGPPPAAGVDPTVAYLLPGRTVARPGSGRRLYARYPDFAAGLDGAVAAVGRHLDGDLRTVLWSRADLLRDPRYNQPAVFALQVAVHRLLRSWGVPVSMVIGDGQGELVAAHFAGMLGLEDTAGLVVARTGAVHIGPGGRGRPGDGAARFADVASAAAWRAAPGPGPEMISGATGVRTDHLLLATPAHWSAQQDGSPRLDRAVTRAERSGVRLFVDLGPGSTLADATAGLPRIGPPACSSPLAGEDEERSVAEVAASAFRHGVALDWTAVHGNASGRVGLPGYPFQRTRFWLPDPLPSSGRAGAPASRPGDPGGLGDLSHLADLARPRPAPPAGPPGTRGHPYPSDGMPGDEAHDLVVRETNSVLGEEPGADLDLDAKFIDLGLDSRMAVALRNVLATRTGRTLPTTLLFDHPTPALVITALVSTQDLR